MLNQEQKFPSKKGPVIYIPLIIFIIVGGSFVAGGVYGGALLVAGVMSVVFLPMLFNTYYAITDDGVLRIKCGIFYNTTIPIESITKITDIKSILSAPALSLDRLEVFYNKFDSVMISPADKTGFVAALQNINPAIRY